MSRSPSLNVIISVRSQRQRSRNLVGESCVFSLGIEILALESAWLVGFFFYCCLQVVVYCTRDENIFIGRQSDFRIVTKHRADAEKTARK